MEDWSGGKRGGPARRPFIYLLTEASLRESSAPWRRRCSLATVRRVELDHQMRFGTPGTGRSSPADAAANAIAARTCSSLRLGKALGKKAFDAMGALITKALASDPFYEVQGIAARARPSTAKISVERSLRATPDTKSTAVVEVELGQAFFAVTIGAGVSSIPEQTFGQVESLVPDGSGGTTLGKRFAVTNESKPTPWVRCCCTRTCGVGRRVVMRSAR